MGVTVDSTVLGGGYQNCGCIRPVGVGHDWYAVSGCDVAGYIATADGINWKMANKNLYFGYHHVAAVIGSAMVANRVWGFSSRINDGTGANSGQLLRGTYSATTGLIDWSHIGTIDPGAVTGGSNRPRHAGRLLALDEANNAVYMATIDGIWRFDVSGANPVRRALAGQRVSGIVLDTDDPQIMYATLNNGGVVRITNIRSGTVTTQTKAFNDCQDLVFLKVGGAKYLFVAAMGQGPQRWTGTTDITSGWTSLAGGYNLGSNGCAKVDAHPVGSTIGSVKVLCGNAGNSNSSSGGSVSNNGGGTWSNEATDWNVSTVPWGETLTWWLTDVFHRVSLDDNTWRANSAAIDHADPSKLIFFGRSGAWRSADGGTTWRPTVRGFCATIGRLVAAQPGGGDRAAGADTDWCAVISSTEGFASGKVNGHAPSTSACFGIGFRADTGKLGIAIETGQVFTTANPFVANPTWAEQGFAAAAG